MKLFVKIFLWFLAAIALMAGVIIFLNSTIQTEPVVSRFQTFVKYQTAVYAETTAQILDAEGDAGLQQFLNRLRATDAIREIDLIGKDGRVLTADSDEVGSYADLIEKARASGTSEIDVSFPDTALAADPLTLKNGDTYVLIIRWDRPRPLPMFGESRYRYLRLLGLLLTSLLVCYALARYLSSPIGKIRRATQKLAAGDLHTRVADQIGRRRDELADLARDFDVMAERIESLITSQQRLTRDVSHELRSPLARLNVALEIAKQKSGAETAPVLDRIETESSRLNDMISRLLTLAKLETGDGDIDPVRVDLCELVRDVAADAEFEAKALGKFVEVSGADSCTVMGSETLLRSAIENVLRNAVRYTADRTVVEVSLAANNGHAVLKVSDHGGGIPEGDLTNVFRPFYRVGEARERKTGGIGLGLAIAERAVKAHKGTITAKNFNDGLLIEISLDTARTG